MKKIVFLLVSIIAFNALAKEKDISNFSWTSKEKDTLNSHQDLKKFTNKLLSINLENYDIMPPFLGEFGFFDLNNDGKLELVVQRNLEPYQGASRIALETVVYSWKNGKFVQNSKSFPEFYKNKVIPDIKKKMIEDKQGADSEIAEMQDAMELKSAEQKLK